MGAYALPPSLSWLVPSYLTSQGSGCEGVHLPRVVAHVTKTEPDWREAALLLEQLHHADRHVEYLCGGAALVQPLRRLDLLSHFHRYSPPSSYEFRHLSPITYVGSISFRA